LSTAHCLTGLQFSLDNNAIGDAGAPLLARALGTGRCPAGLQINIADNAIGELGATQLAEALRGGRCPMGLQLNLNGAVTERVRNQIHKLLEINEKKQAATSWIAFHHGLRSSHPLLKKISDVVAQNIFSFLVPCTIGENLGLFFTQVKRKALPTPAGQSETLRRAALHPKIARFLLEDYARRNAAAARDDTALREAARKGDLEMVRLLLKSDAVRNAAAARGNEALREAAAYGHLEIVRLLLEMDVVRNAIIAKDNLPWKGIVDNALKPPVFLQRSY
jgi:hypothetical protein